MGSPGPLIRRALAAGLASACPGFQTRSVGLSGQSDGPGKIWLAHGRSLR